jgi:CO/xanthine dehydrogenase Mo-binding subunit
MSIRSKLKINTRVSTACNGAKSAGQIACVQPMAAIANANFNTTGVRIKTLPLGPENVLRALKEEGNA